MDHRTSQGGVASVLATTGTVWGPSLGRSGSTKDHPPVMNPGGRDKKSNKSEESRIVTVNV